jgi:uncharacterized protein YbjT (DUF2867 family)
MSAKTALIIGATGLVGEVCLTLLLENKAYEKVIALTRKPLNISNPKLTNHVVDFDNLEVSKALIKADDVFCAMGTTIGKAGSKEAFRKVDFDYPHKIAETALWNGAQKFILVSSAGADANSSIFYSKVKGELENAVSEMKYKSVIILRPSILLGNRKELRRGEAIGQMFAAKFSFLFAGPLAKYRGTPASYVAEAMIKTALVETPKLTILENLDIFKVVEK